MDTFGIPRVVLDDSLSHLDQAGSVEINDPETPSFEQLENSVELVVAETAYLKQLKGSHRARARAAMQWRPRFVKALATSCNWTSALKGARVSYNTVRAHQKNDAEFAAQISEAEEYGAQLLHDAAWKSALEGDLEPVFWQGIRVGHVRKFDSRLRIEMLRAHLPDRFKRDNHGAKVNVHTGPGSQVLVIGPAEQQELIAARRASLLRLKAAHEQDQQPIRPIADELLPHGRREP